jgi:cell division protein FtsA
LSKIILGIDIGSTKICAIIAQSMDDSIKILGAGISKSGGIKKGIITNIDQASRSIKRAVGDAKKVSGTHYDDVIVSISGAYAKSVDSYGVVNAPNKEIGLNEIKRVLEMADHNANIPTEYERLHVLPYNFKVDEHDSIDDPLGMNGTRLEVNVHIITVLKSSLNNLKKAIKSASIEAKNIVLSGYASSISVLNDDERELGVAVIDIGGATTDIVVHKGHSIRYNEFIGVGSSNITNDLSMALHTPLISAEEIKIKYGSLLNQDSGVIKIPSIGDENISNDASLDTIKNVILARTQETLVIVSNYLKESKYLDKLGAGIVLTGGLTKIEGIRELAISIFGNVPVRVAKPAENSISGMFDTLKSSEYATTIGLILYGAGISTSYEMDSNRQLRAYEEPSSNHISQGDESIYEDDDRLSLDIAHKDQSDNNTFEVILEPEQKRGVISRFFNRILNIF